jgi:hypothetical protein
VRPIIFFLIFLTFTYVQAAQIICIKDGIKILDQQSDKIYIDSSKQFITFENTNLAELNDADCTIKYKFKNQKKH